jgi:hypothetical protein
MSTSACGSAPIAEFSNPTGPHALPDDDGRWRVLIPPPPMKMRMRPVRYVTLRWLPLQAVSAAGCHEGSPTHLWRVRTN